MIIGGITLPAEDTHSIAVNNSPFFPFVDRFFEVRLSIITYDFSPSPKIKPVSSILYMLCRLGLYLSKCSLNRLNHSVKTSEVHASFRNFSMGLEKIPLSSGCRFLKRAGQLTLVR